ncbi:hypothetical protein [Metabacillus sp. FJAT-52054]|uniref:Uncharacterized protein n=1 Tax=Metabacillus sediminis TaxID=3117746 RepID=A0ABZ2NHL8_9BACI
MAILEAEKIDHNEERLNQLIMEYIDKGLKWSDIASRLKVKPCYIRSVFFTKRKKEVEEGGVIRYWNNHRITDGVPSPVTTYHISELTEEERSRHNL